MKAEIDFQYVNGIHYATKIEPDDRAKAGDTEGNSVEGCGIYRINQER